MKALVRYHEVVMWKKPGGCHHVKILHMGAHVNVVQGWEYKDRPWKDKRYVKVYAGGQTGYILAEALCDEETKLRPPNWRQDGTEEATYEYEHT